MVNLPREFAWVSPNAHPKPRGRIKACPADFKVCEILDERFDDEGEHTYLHIEKKLLTTVDVRKSLAEHFRVPQMDVGYAGMKDRNAVARQWFSVRLPKTDEIPTHDNFTVLEKRLHRTKLRPGDALGNSFEVKVRSVKQPIDNLLEDPIPNYFGVQRFGRNFNNIPAAVQWMHDRSAAKNQFTKSVYISTLRAWLFNEVLSQRIQNADWPNTLPGDLLHDGVPTGPMWGRGRLETHSAAREFEERTLASFREICNTLEWVGLRQERRDLIVTANDVSSDYCEDVCVVKFILPSGSYATVALGEYFNLEQSN